MKTSHIPFLGGLWGYLFLFLFISTKAKATEYKKLNGQDFQANCTVIANASSPTATDGAVQIALSGGSSPYSYQLTDVFGLTIIENDNIFGNVFSLTGLPAGNLELTAIAADGAISTCNFLIGIPEEDCNLEVEIQQQHIFCNYDFVNLTAIVSNGFPPFEFLWEDGTTTAARNALPAGDYSVSVTDNFGCTVVQNFTATPIPSMELDISATPASSLNASDGSVQINFIDGNFFFLFDIFDENGIQITHSGWHPVGATISVGNLSPGQYELFVQDIYSCGTVVFPFVIGSGECTLTADVIMATASCFGDLVEVEAIASGGVLPYTYLWEDGTSTAANSLPEGIHDVTITDNLGCITTTTAIITAPSGLIVNCNVGQHVSVSGLSNGSAIINMNMGGISPYTYHLFNNENPFFENHSYPPSSSLFLSGLSAGDYEFQLVDANNCSQSCFFTINEPECDMEIVVEDNFLNCTGDLGTLTASVSGGQSPYQYAWSNNIFDANNPNLNPGIYTLTVTDDNNCRKEVSASVVEPELLEIQCHILHQGTTFGSPSGEVSLNISGGTAPYQYEIEPINVQGVSSDEAPVIISELSNGDYFVEVIDAGGCVAFCDFTIIPCNLLSSSQVTPATCNGGNDGSINFEISGAEGDVDYDWNINTFDGQTHLSDLSAGIYSVTATDLATGCFLALDFEVEQENGVTIDCFGDFQNGTGSITYTLEGGTGPYQVHTSGPNTQQTSYINQTGTYVVTNLSGGIYQLLVEDAAGCSHSCQVTIGNSIGCDDFSITPYASPGINCNEIPPYAGIHIRGGTPPYTALWSDGTQGLYNNNVLPNTTYQVIVTDAMGCQQQGSIALPAAPAPLTANIEWQPGSDGSTLVAIGMGGTMPYTYEWNDGSTTQAISNIEPGTYSVIIRDAIGCEAEAVFVLQGLTPKGDEGGTNAFIFNTDLNLYPNPTTDKIHLSFSNVLSNDLEIEVFNIRGQQLYSAKIELLQNLVVLSLNDLHIRDAGVYIIKAKTEEMTFPPVSVVKMD